MVLWAGILFDFRKNYHKDDGAKRFHHSFRLRRINRHSSFFLSRILRVREEKWKKYLLVMVTDLPWK